MSRGRSVAATSSEKVISIIGPGMRVVGDCHTTDTVRVEGRVEGSIHAEKAVVVGEGGRVAGDIRTQDAVVAGRIKGALEVDSRLELHATCVIDGEIRATRIRLDEGGIVNGKVSIGRKDAPPAAVPQEPLARAAPPREAGRRGGGGLRGAGKGKHGRGK